MTDKIPLAFGSQATTTTPSKQDVVAKKKEEPVLDLTPLEKMLQNAAPLRDDGVDRFFGLENVRRALPTPARVIVIFHHRRYVTTARTRLT